MVEAVAETQRQKLNRLRAEQDGSPRQRLEALRAQEAEGIAQQQQQAQAQEQQQANIGHTSFASPEMYQAGIEESQRMSTGQAILADAGATLSKVGPNLRRFFAGDEEAKQAAEAELLEIERVQDSLRMGTPEAVFGEPLAIGSTVPATVTMSGALATSGPIAALATQTPTRVAPLVAGGTRIGGEATMAAGEAAAFAPAEADVHEEAATGAAFSLGGEGVMKGGSMLLNKAKNAAKELELSGRSALESSEVVKVIQDKFGINLMPAQQTLSPDKLAEQRVLLTTPEGAKIGIPALKRQNEEAGVAVEEFLSSVASGDAKRIADEEFKKVSERVLIEGQKELSALFKQPYKRIQAKIDAQPEKLFNIVDSVDRRLTKQIEGTNNTTAKNALTKFQQEINNNSTSIEGLRDAKDEIDLILEQLGTDTSSPAAVKKARREIKSVQKQLQAQLNKEFPEFAELNRRFAEKRKEILGPLERVGFGGFANMPEDKLKRMSAQVFDAAETDPKIMEQTKRILKRSGKDAEQAFDNLLRVELDKRILRSKIDLDAVIEGQDVFTKDIPAALKRGIFGSGAQRDVLLKALNPRQRQNAILLEEALERSSAGRILGSQTEQNQAAKLRIEKEPLVRGIWNFLKSPIDKSLGIGSEMSKATRRTAAAELAFDPTWSIQFNKISKIKDFGKQTQAVEDLLQKVEAGVIARTGLRFVEPIEQSNDSGANQ